MRAHLADVRRIFAFVISFSFFVSSVFVVRAGARPTAVCVRVREPIALAVCVCVCFFS